MKTQIMKLLTPKRFKKIYFNTSERGDKTVVVGDYINLLMLFFLLEDGNSITQTSQREVEIMVNSLSSGKNNTTYIEVRHHA